MNKVPSVIESEGGTDDMFESGTVGDAEICCPGCAEMNVDLASVNFSAGGLNNSADREQTCFPGDNKKLSIGIESDVSNDNMSVVGSGGNGETSGTVSIKLCGGDRAETCSAGVSETNCAENVDTTVPRRYESIRSSQPEVFDTGMIAGNVNDEFDSGGDGAERCSARGSESSCAGGVDTTAPRKYETMSSSQSESSDAVMITGNANADAVSKTSSDSSDSCSDDDASMGSDRSGSVSGSSMVQRTSTSKHIQRIGKHRVILVFPFDGYEDAIELQEFEEGPSGVGSLEPINGSVVSNSTKEAGARPRVLQASRRGVHRLTFTRRDAARLEEGRYLNDTLIDFYIQW